MQAHLLLPVVALLVFTAWRLGRRGSTQTQVAGDQVTPQADIAELREFVAQLNARQDQMAHEMHAITQVLKVSLVANARSSEQQGLASVCSTGGHLIQHRVR